MAVAEGGDVALVAAALESESEYLWSVQRRAGLDGVRRRQVAADEASAAESGGSDDQRGADEDDVFARIALRAWVRDGGLENSIAGRSTNGERIPTNSMPSSHIAMRIGRGAINERPMKHSSVANEHHAYTFGNQAEEQDVGGGLGDVLSRG